MPTLQRLFDPVNQFELRNGQLNVAGKLYVYLNGTDDLANVYGNNMEQLAQPIILDADGRAPGLFVDSSHMYWIKVCGRGGNEQYSVKDMVPIGSGSGGGSGSEVEVVSTDGTVHVGRSVDGGVKTFDLSVAEDSTECLEWFDGGVQELSSGDVYPTLEAGTMEVEAERGLRVYRDRLYHVTSSFTVTPTGAGVTYNTLEVSLMYVGSGSPVPVMTREYDIDNSLTDHVDIGFGCDVMAPGDGLLYWHVAGAENFARVDGRMQVHRVYSGVAAVPGTVATKTWVEGNFQQQSGMSSYVGYSAVSGSSGMVTAIGGSAISAGTDSATVSAIASAYAGSAASGKMDSSASSGFYPASNPSGFAQESGLSAYIPFSAIGGSGSSISGINGSAIGGGGKTYSGVWPVVVDNSADTVSVDHIPLCTDSTITAYMSGGSAVLGVVPSSIDMSGYAKESALSAKLDASASGDFMLASGMTAYQPSGDYAYNSAVSSKMDASGMTAYQEKSGMSAYQPSGDYAYNSALSSKFDASASSSFYPASNPSGFIGSSDTSALGYSSMGTITVIGRNLESTDSARLGMEEITTGHQWMNVYGVTIDFSQIYFTAGNSASIYMQSLEPTANIRAVEFRDQNYTTISTVGVEASSVSMPMPSGTRYMTVTGDNYGSVEFNYTAKNVVPGTVVPLAHRSALSAKMDKSASSNFMMSSGMSAYQLSGDYAYNSAVSGKFDASASGDFMLASGMTAYQPSGDYAYNSAVSGKLDASASSDFMLASGMTAYQPSGDYAYNSAVSSKLDASASSDFMLASGMTAYQPSGDYAFNSAVSGKLDASASSDFMLASGMSAYQLSGDYAYNSALSSKFDESGISAYIPFSALSGDGTAITGISGSAIGGGGGGGSISADANFTGSGTDASPLGLARNVTVSGTGNVSSWLQVLGVSGTASASAKLNVIKGKDVILQMSGVTTKIQATGNSACNFSYNCDWSGKAAMFSGPWTNASTWAGVSSQFNNGSALFTVRASGANKSARIGIVDNDGSAYIYRSSVSAWDNKMDASASSLFIPASAVTDIQLVTGLPGTPVATVLYLIPE